MEKVQKLTASTAIVLETRVPRKDGTYPVKLRITYNRKQKYYSTRYKIEKDNFEISDNQRYWLDRLKGTISLTKLEFKKVRNPSSREPYKTMVTYLNELEALARDVISTLPTFTFTSFEKKYYEKPANKRDLLYDLNSYVTKLLKEGRISTALSYKNALKSFQKYTGKKQFSYDNVTVSFLNNYEKWMIKEGNSLTTVGIYLRNVRTAYRKAETDGIIKSHTYPFGEGKYVIPTGKNIKKALSLKEVGMIAHFPVVEGSSEHRYRDYWLLSYLCNGLNIKDLARLTYDNIEGDIIKIIRAKTEREKRQNPRLITIVITKEIGRIIDRWGNKPGLPDKYVLPILSEGMVPEKEYKAIQQTIKMINKYIKDIAESVGISQKVTSYTARHSYATVLKRSGASNEFISESLGHSNLQTTENYLADFEIEEKRKWAKKAADF